MSASLSERLIPKGKVVVNNNGFIKSTKSEHTDKSKNSKTTSIIFVSLLLDLLAFTMILPLLPSLMEHYRKYDDENGLYPWLLNKLEYLRNLVGAPERFNSVLFGGLLGSLFSFLQFVASPIVGGLSDAYGRRPVLISCLVGIACSYVLWALSHSFAVFVLARVVGGISKGNVSLSMAIITDVSTTATRGFGMALVGIAFSIGFIVGSVIGAMFARRAQTQAGHSVWFTVPTMVTLSLTALVGIAFSIGFIVGPVIGAMFARWTQTQAGHSHWFIVPAMFALSLTALVGIAFSIGFIVGPVIGAMFARWAQTQAGHSDWFTVPATFTLSLTALVGIAFSIGFIVGPVIGAMFARWAQTQAGHSDWFTVPAMFALSLAVIDVLFVVLCFQETLPKNKRASITQSLSQASAYISIPALFNFTAVTGLSHNDSKELTMLGLVYFVYLFLYSGLEFTITFLTHLTFGFTSMQQGYMFFCIGLVMAILQGAWVRRIPPQSTKKMAAHGLLLIVPSFLCVGLASSPLLLYIGLFLFAVSTSIVVPCMTTMASQFGTDAQKGTVMGIFRSLGALARAMGPVFASLCYWSLGSTLTYCLGGVALLWPWYTLFRSRR
ncbi:Major facilitator super domain-containing protein 10 [Homalodisca vitripennis]|nr:Major facilitator super domain-containing protein 10 [Homalodisca vitripennis]